MFREMKMRYPNKLFVYMDDILIATNNDLMCHRQIVHQVLDKLEEESYFLRPAKCEFKKEKVDYLGVVISRERIHIDPIKVKGLRNWPQKLGTLKQVRLTLGILGYQRLFIPGFAHIAQPLTNLLKKGTNFLWMDAHSQAVDFRHHPQQPHPLPTQPPQTVHVIDLTNEDSSNDDKEL